MFWKNISNNNINLIHVFVLADIVMQSPRVQDGLNIQEAETDTDGCEEAEPSNAGTLNETDRRRSESTAGQTSLEVIVISSDSEEDWGEFFDWNEAVKTKFILSIGDR